MVLEALEERATPTVGFGYGFALGASGDDSVTSVATDSQGNVYVAGSFNGTVDFDPGPGVHDKTSTGNPDPIAGNPDAFLAKYSASGSLLWVGRIAGAGPINYGRLGLAVDANDNVYLTGGFSGTTDFDLGNGISTLDTYGLDTGSAFVAKYTSDGGLTWARALGGGTAYLTVTGNSIAVDGSGNVYTAGTMSYGTADLDPGLGGFRVTNSGGNADTYLSKLDASGNFVWGGLFAGDPTSASAVWPDGIAVDASQNLYISGLYVGSVDFDPGSGTLQKISGAGLGSHADNAYVVKLTPSGTVGYFVTVGSYSGQQDAASIAVDSVGNAYVTGEFEGQSSILAPDGSLAGSLLSAGSYDAYVMKLDPSGELDWAKRIGASSADEGMGIVLNGADNLYLTGLFTGTVDFDPGPGEVSLTGRGLANTFVMQMGADGSFGWAEALNGTSYLIGNDIAIDGQGGVYTVGRFKGTAYLRPDTSYGGLTSAGGDDGFVSKLVTGLTDQAPSAEDDTYSLDENSPNTITAAMGTLSNDSDPDNDPLSVIVVARPVHGSLSMDDDGSFTYTPDKDFLGTDTFTYVATDGPLDSDTATVTITVNPVNHPPAATDQTARTDEDFNLIDTLTATDPDGDPLTYEILTQPEHGRVVLLNKSTGRYTYQPFRDENGPDSFTFRVNDGQADSNVATVSISVRPVNDPPAAAPDTYGSVAAHTDEDLALEGQLDATDVDGDPLTFSLDSSAEPPEHGSVVVHPDGTYVYTPDPEFDGTDSFVFKVTDDKGASDSATVTVTVWPKNDAPNAQDDQFVVQENGVLSVQAVATSMLKLISQPGDYIGQGSAPLPRTYNFSASDSQFSQQWDHVYVPFIEVFRQSDQQWWDFTFAAPDKAQLTPGVYTGATRYPFQDPGQPGLEITGGDRGANQLTGQFIIFDVGYDTDGSINRLAASFVQSLVKGPDSTVQPPLSGYVVYNSTFGAGGGVLGNDSDIDGDNLLTAQLVSGPAHGTLDMSADGTFTYTPDAGFVGTDSFTYQASDGSPTSPPAKVSIKVNGAPGATDDSWTLYKNNTLMVPADRGVLGNDSDPNGDPLSAQTVANPAHGSLTFNDDGSFTYTPEPGFSGTDTFTYKANDGQADSNVATVALSVKALNRQAMAQQGDYDGDGQADIMVFRPDDPTHGHASVFYVLSSATGQTITQPFGSPSLQDQPLIGDYDGDSQTDFAVFRPEDPNYGHNSVFYVLSSATGQTLIQPFGSPSLHDQPITGDFDGDGQTDFAVFRPEDPNFGHTSVFYVLDSSTGQTAIQPFGSPGLHDQPLIGDYDGDGQTDFAIFRPDDPSFGHASVFFVLESSTGQTATQPFGSPYLQDLPLTGDFDGDGKTDFAVFRPGTATYYIKESSSGDTLVQPYGWIGHDQPLLGDYDGDGTTDFAVFRPDDATFRIRDSATRQDSTQPWGWIGHDRLVLANSGGMIPVDQPSMMPSSHQVRTLSVATAQKVRDILDRHELGDI